MNSSTFVAWPHKSPDYSILEKVFSKSTFIKLLSGIMPDYCNEAFSMCGVDNLDVDYMIKFRKLYGCMRKNYPNEFFYKNVLMNRILFGLHSPNTTVALTELPVGSARADIVMINGNAMVYEIKSNLDNFERLGHQIEQYYRAFKLVTVVVPEHQVNCLLRRFVDSPIGLCTVKKGDHISVIKKAVEFTEFLDVDIMFEMFNKKEIDKILLQEDGYLPKVGCFDYYEECRKKICVFGSLKVHDLLKSFLKARKKVDVMTMKLISPEWKMLAYTLNLNMEQANNFIKFLDRR